MAVRSRMAATAATSLGRIHHFRRLLYLGSLLCPRYACAFVACEKQLSFRCVDEYFGALSS